MPLEQQAIHFWTTQTDQEKEDKRKVVTQVLFEMDHSISETKQQLKPPHASVSDAEKYCKQSQTIYSIWCPFSILEDGKMI